MPDTAKEADFDVDSEGLPTVPPAEMVVAKPDNDVLPPLLQARILIWSENYGELAAANAFEVSESRVRKIRNNFVSRPEEHPALTRAVKKLRDMEKERWGDVAHSARAAAINFISRASHQGDAKDPDMVNAITNALTVISEIIAVDRYLDAKILALGLSGTGNPEGGSVDAIDSQPGRHPRAT